MHALGQVCFSVGKAFTRESDEAEADEVPLSRIQLPAGSKNYITREGADRLRHNLDELLERKRSWVSMDKGADPDAKTQLRRIESTIRKLRLILDSIVVAEIPDDREKVGFGASVLIRHGKGEEEGYQIVGIDESDPGQGRISWISPLARALLNRRKGDTIRFQSPAGDQELRIVQVSYLA